MKKVVIGASGLLIVALILLGVFYYVIILNKDTVNLADANDKVCSTNNDCVKIQTTCCPCEMGGEESCVPRNQADFIKESILKCTKDVICAAVENCKIKSCECVAGNCTAINVKP